MAEIALAGAIAIVDKVLPFLMVGRNCESTYDIEEVKKWLNTMIAYLKDTEGREDTEGWNYRVQQVRDLGYVW
jgi:hypothetical protein